MAISELIAHAHYTKVVKRLRIGLVATLSVVISFFWVLLAPIFSYEPISFEVPNPPGTELAKSGSCTFEHST
jgi:hypothetical protein